MIKLVMQKQKENKYILMFSFFFIGFLVIYTVLDSLNMSYKEMNVQYGVYLTIINIFLNIVMAGMSGLMFNMATALGEINNQKSRTENVPIISVIFGIFTYGCTSCVITFLSAIGIAFSVPALGLAGLPYKLLSFVLLGLGFLWILRSIKRAVCKIWNKKWEIISFFMVK